MADQPRPPRSGRLVRAGLFAATLGVGVGLAAIPVDNWLDQRAEVDAARERRDVLVGEIAEIDAEIEGIIGEDGLEIAARCYGPYVEVGEEIYSVPGLDGCVTNPTP
jgi:hypothetical protein